MAAKHMVAKSDVKLEHEVTHYDLMPKGMDYYENFGQMILAAAVDNDMMLWTSPYILKGTTPGNYLVDDSLVLQSTLIMVPQKERGVMRDNDFISTGWNPQEYLKLKDLNLIKEKDKITWQIKNWKHIAHPPYWELKGSHAGIGLDITMSGLGPAFWYMGPWEDMSKADHGGFDQVCDASGSITVGGKTYKLSEAYAVHEHLGLGKSTDMVELLSKGTFHWALGFNDDLQFLTFIQAAQGRAYGRLLVDRQMISYDTGVTLDELAWWEDPRSGIRVPRKWHINMFSTQGILDINVAAGGRAYYFYALKKGYLTMYWFLASANGRFMFPDGRELPIKDVRVGIEWGRTILLI